MDLYRVLRLSFYAMVAAAVLPLAIAERSFACAACVVCAGLVAGLALDRGRIPPVRPVFVYALALALLVYHFIPLRDEDAWRQHGLSAVAGFLCYLPAFLFFLSYGNAVLFVTGADALALVIISGILDPGPGLFLRMACFVGLSAWTLLLHSLWRAREDFRVQGTPYLIRRRSSEAYGTGSPELGMVSPELALRQGLALTALLSLAGLALGMFLFFSAPRLNETVTAWLQFLVRDRDPLPAGVDKGGVPGQREGPSTTGPEEAGLSVIGLGPLYSNRSPALTVTFHAPQPALSPGGRGWGEGDSQAIAPHGRILLRGQALSEYEDGRWQVPPLLKDANLRPPADASAPGVTWRGAEFQQDLAPNETLRSSVCYSAGPVSRLSIARTWADTEGLWHAASGTGVPARGDGDLIREPYQVWSYPPVRAEDLPADAEAVHPERRYLRCRLPDYVRQEVLDFAKGLAKDDDPPVQKVRNILAKLRESRAYTYTWQLGELKRTGDPIAHFLLSPDPLLRRGHCGYFASAFVLLCRLNKLPARLATGFAAPLPADWKDGQSNQVIFRNSDAHAWGEVFFKGFGWVAFDPTPAAPPPPAVVGVPAPTPAVPPPAAPPQSFLSRVWKTLIDYDGKKQRALYRKVGEPLGSAGNVLAGEGRGGWLGAALAWTAAVVAVWWMMQAFLRRGRAPAPRRTAAAARARAAMAFYNDLLQTLSRRGFVRKPGQTPREFAAHVLRHGGQAFKSVLVVTEVFENVRYGGREITQEEFNRLQEALDNLRELTFVAVPA